MERRSTHSLSTDAVDRYNYKWMAMLLLLLSLTAFIIPLHPSYQNQSGESTLTTTTRQPSKTKTSKSQEINVVCWCPAHFPMSSIAYAHSYCKNALLDALRGENTTSVYDLPMDDIIPVNDARNQIPLTTSRKEYFDMKRVEQRREERREERRENIRGRVQKLITFQAPIMLLVAAILLTLPHVLWSALSSCCGSFNVDQTLESASQVTGDEVIQASIATVVRTCPNSLSTLYLLKKVMSVVVVLVLLIVVCKYALPMVEELDKDLDSVSPTKNKKRASSDTTITPSVNPFTYNNGLFEHPKDVFGCQFEIRQLQNVQTFEIQCLAVQGDVDDIHDEAQPKSSISSVLQSAKSSRNLVEFESLLFKIVTALLAILAGGNLASLCAWLCKLLTSSSRNSMGLSSDTAMDIAFLVHMARINCGVVVGGRLAQSSSSLYEMSEGTKA